MRVVVATVALVAASSQVSDGSLLVAIPIAVAAGLVSFLSPCVLPLVPGYLGYVTGMTASDLAAEDTARHHGSPQSPPAGDGGNLVTAVRPADTETAAPVPTRHPTRRIVLGTLGFVSGIAFVFVSFGAVFGAFGQLMREHELLLTRIFGVVTILLGLLLAGVFGNVAWANRELRVHRLPRAGLAGAPLLGITFALGWTPCIGPTLGVVLGLAASSDEASAARGAVLSFAYCLGLGVPFLVTGLMFNRAMRAFAGVRRHARGLMVAGGVVLVGIGILQVTGVWVELMNQLQTRFGGTDLPL